VCVARWTNASEPAAAAATRSVAHRMCTIVYVFLYFRVCVWVDIVCGLPIGLGDFIRIILESINRKMINFLENILNYFLNFIKSIYWKETKIDFGFNFLKRVVLIGMSIYAYCNGIKLAFFFS
jgi:hypothetical protein